MKKMLVGLLAGGVFLGAVIGLAQKNNRETGGGAVATPTPLEDSATASPTPQTTSAVPEEWQRSRFDTQGVSVAHPPDVRVEETARDGIELVKWGPTQREGTELYDGIRLVLQALPLPTDMDLRAVVESEVAELESGPIESEVGEVEPVSVAEMEGYRIEVAGMGKREHYYLELSESRYLRVIDGTVDPTGQGFEETADRILKSLDKL